MRLFRREKPTTTSPCPRCSEIVSANATLCPMCGWDLGDAYQGPAPGSTPEPDTTVAGLFDTRGGE
jgi:hypothetical protein